MNVALKEWASVIQALAVGRQSILVRKGGIAESQRGFQLKHEEFLLFPTYEHQKPELLLPEFRGLIETVEPSEIRLGWLGQVTDVRQLQPGERPSERLHIYTPEFFEIREKYRPDHPLYQLTLSVRALPHEVTVPNRPSYAGCKSWVYLTEEIDAGSLSHGA